jgi:LPXTG-motif cell wall-anchored protein
MRGRRLAAALLGAVGLVWMAQGAGFLPGTGFMDGDVTWVVIGAGLVLAGVLLAVSAARRRPPDPRT